MSIKHTSYKLQRARKVLKHIEELFLMPHPQLRSLKW